MKLKGKQKHYLRGLGHHLKPILQIGKEGLSDQFLENLEDCLEHHELLKIRVLESVSEEKKVLSSKLEKCTGGAVAQVIGRTLLFYRPFKKEPVIILP